jgi:hypothetical protein
MMTGKSKSRKRYKPTEIMVACHARYGHLKVGIEAVGAPDKFNVYMEDARVNKRSKQSAEFEGSARDALAAAIEMARKYLELRGELSDHEASCECIDLGTMKPVPAPRLINGTS